MQERFDFGRKFLRQIFELRAEARLHSLSGPDQLFTECGQRGAPATMGFDQGNAEKIGPLLDEIPYVAIGEVGMVRRAGKFPSLSDLVENSEHHHGGLWTALLVKPPDGFDFDMEHRFPNVMKAASYTSFIIGRLYHIYYGKYSPTVGHKQRRKYDVDCIWLFP